MSFSDSRSPSPSSSSPRKRPRTDATSEERKEARAHRNRIAAQNSRDRRKAQFAYLEQRVAELEEENRILRARRGVPLPHELHSPPSTGGVHRLSDGPAAGELVHFPPTDPVDDDAAMQNFFMEILASPLPADPATPSTAAATAPRSAAQTPGSVQAPAEAGPDATKVALASGVEAEAGVEMGMGIVDLAIGLSRGGDVGAESTGIKVDLGLMTTDEQQQQQQQGWDSGLEMQRILASLGVIESQPSELEIELGWTTFGVEGTGVGVF
ncbi:hypothetical protein C0989_011503 [Termitomyces sp. Mn162]|nr:hypothetical protein C0989_011503 [Termitomyces sp. Mn162]